MTSPWIAALGATLLMQVIASFMAQSLPVVAPLLTGDLGLQSQAIGNLSALNAFGTVLFLAFGGPFLARLGPVRMLQIGAALSAVGLLALVLGTVPALVFAAVLLGVGYGPSPPAGSRILAATAPPRHRSLIFSVKQAGAPMGGVLAGLITAPVASAFGWGAALAVCAATAFVAALSIQGLRRDLDAERDPARSISPRSVLSPRTLALPFTALTLAPALLPLTYLAISFAVVQGCLFTFTVTWLVETRGMSLVQAGTVFAAMQGSGVVARIVLGWLADRTGRPIVNLLVQGLVASGAVLMLAALPQSPGLLLTALLAGFAGFVGASWNGIYLAEIARLSSKDRISDATSGSTLLCFLGYVVGPVAYGVLVTASGGWLAPMLFTAVQLAVVTLLVAPTLLRASR
ncbi:MFS transporter [Roseomonas sp. AR75]|uniref:MFS transporter n=1 Tax=Roseomonas sp. AR75 TaxID=2562311 RepID=UPI0014851341|nr:MFS transporter [Roseomonas sp. AR75]